MVDSMVVFYWTIEIKFHSYSGIPPIQTHLRTKTLCKRSVANNCPLSLFNLVFYFSQLYHLLCFFQPFEIATFLPKIVFPSSLSLSLYSSSFSIPLPPKKLTVKQDIVAQASVKALINTRQQKRSQFYPLKEIEENGGMDLSLGTTGSNSNSVVMKTLRIMPPTNFSHIAYFPSRMQLALTT